MTVSTRPHLAPRAGFTLIELLVVLGIIGALVAITLGIGSAMVESGKARQTADTIKVLDMIASEHRASTDAGVPWYVSVPNGDSSYAIPLIDGVDRPDVFNGATQTKYVVPTVTWYLKQITEYTPMPSAESLLNQIDGKLRSTENAPAAINAATLMEGPNGRRLAVLDAWGRPIRMVHPKLDGVIPTRSGALAADGGPLKPIREYVTAPTGHQYSVVGFRRNYISNADRLARQNAGLPAMIGDSDGGSCTSDVPYFYSAGKDGDPSTRSDNVYSTRPKFADPD